MCAAIVARRDPPPVFEPSEHVFYSVTFFIERLVEIMLDFAVASGRNARLDALLDQCLAEPVAIIAPVTGERFGFGQSVEHEPCPFMIAHLAFAEQQDQRLAIAIGDSMKL